MTQMIQRERTGARSDQAPTGLVHGELSGRIIGAAMTVLNELRPGLNEKLYENALVLELKAQGLHVEQQRRYVVRYRGRVIGKLIPDLVVEEEVIVDPKVVECFHETHVAKMLGYLAISSLELALLLNFKYAKLQWKRIVRTAEDVSPEDKPF